MSAESWRELLLAAFALLLMALAASVEATATLVSRHRLRQIAEERGQRSVQGLLDPRRSLVAALVLVEAVAIATAASLLTTVAGRELGTAEHVVAVAAVALVFLLLGQALPRALAATNPERAAVALVGLARVLAFVVRPLTIVVDALARGLARVLPGPSEPPPPVGTEEELRVITIEGDDGGVIEAEEREMIDNVLHLEATTARDIMVPRVDVVAVEERTPPREIVETITGAGHSRLPVYRESIDHIVGVLYAKDLLPFVIGNTQELPLATLVRPPHVVPESKRVDDLLTELRRSRVHIAIVADEYGGFAGLVTIEDILEEIVGEIQDEYDVEVQLVERVGEGELIADGRLPLADVAEEFGLSLGEDDSGTVAGFVQRHLGRLPNEGDRFETDGLGVEVIAVEGRRVRRLRLLRLADGTGAEPANGAGPDGPTAARERTEAGAADGA
ncbi:MAG: hemolysin family protein [Chloroflexota bacterium]|nr:hemolysin family protein [Chloroflexota bacterium]